MARGRFLSESIAKDIRLNSMSVEAELVYLMTIPHLDRDGLIEGDTDILYGTVCPKRRQFIDRMGEFIREWTHVGLVMTYDTDEGPVLWFRGFAKNQLGLRYDRETPSRFPPPPGYERGKDGIVVAEPPDTDSGSDGEAQPFGDSIRQESGNVRLNAGDSRKMSAQWQVQDQVQDQVKEQQPPAARGGVGKESDSAVGAVFTCWADNMPGSMTPIVADMIDDWIETYGPDETIRAIGVAVQNNKRNANYVNGVLKNRAAGIDPKMKAKQDSYDSPRKRMKVIG